MISLSFATYIVPAAPFRPPAIPLLTTDPFIQTWMRGDTATSAQVTHWDGVEKQMTGFARVDGSTIQFLGSCSPQPATKPGPATALPGHNISPGSCDIANFANMDEAACNIACYNDPKCAAYVLNSKQSKCWLKSCATPVTVDAISNSGVITGKHPSCGSKVAVAKQIGVTVHPTRTIFELELGTAMRMNLTFLSTLFTDDFARLSRPVSYVTVDLASMDGESHGIELFFDVSAQHAVNNCAAQQVAWSMKATMTGDHFADISLGNAVQNILGSKGDRVNIDWGHLHLGTATRNAAEASMRLWAGSATTARSAFASAGTLPVKADTRQPRNCSDDLVVLASQASLGNVGDAASHTWMFAYDEGEDGAINYFNQNFSGLWSYGPNGKSLDIHSVMSTAYDEHDAMLAKSESHDAALMTPLTTKFGEKYAQLCALSYRQTLAATKLVWNHNLSTTWNFLKEISTNGDMQTMDVIYPASPMLLYTNPELLRLLLIPVLAYAHNDTYINFNDPYSPHQLGTYPIGDSTTAKQEPMPLENSGNMFFMLLGIVRAQTRAKTGDVTWIAPYFPMLQTWADELVLTTEFPANQICTDDFTGKLANNTNLGCKGIIAIETFAELCRLGQAAKVPTIMKTDCAHYTTIAAQYAKTWESYAFTSEGSAPHYKMSFNDLSHINITDGGSWSIKYNMLWQKMNGLTGPFANWDAIIATELKFYETKSNKFGIPMDPRHTYVKSDWLSWIAAMAPTDAQFHSIFDPIYDELSATPDRNPFTDLYDTVTAAQSSGGFIARPVIGGMFAKALLDMQ